jgi:hypothetical protein
MMRTPSPSITVVTDISANIFAVLLLILIILLAAGEQEGQPQAQEAPSFEIGDYFTTIERTPLSGSGMVDLLYSRRNASGAIKIDLFEDGIDVLSKDKSDWIASEGAIGERLKLHAGAALEAPVALYVFGHRWYDSVVKTLTRMGRAWQEVSVPEALRDTAGANRKDRWSGGFSDLIGRPLGRDRFRRELAHLLGSGNLQRNERAGAGSIGRAHASVSRYPIKDTILERFLRWWQNILSAIAILSGFGFIAWVETHKWRVRSSLIGINEQSS